MGRTTKSFNRRLGKSEKCVSILVCKKTTKNWIFIEIVMLLYRLYLFSKSFVSREIKALQRVSGTQKQGTPWSWSAFLRLCGTDEVPFLRAVSI